MNNKMPVLFSKEEHQAFLQGIKKHHRKWLLIQSEFLPNKTIIQIRQYALDYFTVLKKLKVETKPHQFTSSLEEVDEEGDSAMPTTIPSTNFSAESLATSFFSMPVQLEYWKQFISNKQTQQQNPMQYASLEDMKQYLQTIQQQQQQPSSSSTTEETIVHYEKLYKLINGLMDPFHFDPIPLYQSCNAKEKEILQIALHRLSITISGKLFHEKYTKDEQS